MSYESRQTGVFLVLMSGYESKDVMAYMLSVTVLQYNNAKSWYVPIFVFSVDNKLYIGYWDLVFYELNAHFFPYGCPLN